MKWWWQIIAVWELLLVSGPLHLLFFPVPLLTSSVHKRLDCTVVHESWASSHHIDTDSPNNYWWNDNGNFVFSTVRSPMMKCLLARVNCCTQGLAVLMWRNHKTAFSQSTMCFCIKHGTHTTTQYILVTNVLHWEVCQTGDFTSTSGHCKMVGPIPRKWWTLLLPIPSKFALLVIYGLLIDNGLFFGETVIFKLL